MSSIPPNHHLAAILPSAGSPLQITHRPTPTPGPNEVLIEVKSIALNPVDWAQREFGAMVTQYPTVLGSDVAGIVISTGSSIASSHLKPGDRVVAFASGYFHNSDPDYGAFQKRVIVPVEKVFLLPESIGFNEGTLLPMGVSTAWSGFYSIGIVRDTQFKPEEKKGIVVWGGASSIGSAAIQVAKSMGFVVYTTASPSHHEYLKTLGAARVFDYKNEDVVEQICKAAKGDGLTMDVGYDAVPGALQQCIDVLRKMKGDGKAKLASAPLLPEGFTELEGVEVKFANTPADAKEKAEFFQWVFNVWLKDALSSGAFVPSPKVKLLPGGLEGLNEGLDGVRKGLSGAKIVLEI
jgi:NADPH:quinone reductase-like Zn-dependent oxidoreductase